MQVKGWDRELVGLAERGPRLVLMGLESVITTLIVGGSFPEWKAFWVLN